MRHPFVIMVCVFLAAMAIILMYSITRRPKNTDCIELLFPLKDGSLMPTLALKPQNKFSFETTGSNERRNEMATLRKKYILLGGLALALILSAPLMVKMLVRAIRPAPPSESIFLQFYHLALSYWLLTLLSSVLGCSLILKYRNIPLPFFSHCFSKRTCSEWWSGNADLLEKLSEFKKLYSLKDQSYAKHYNELVDRISSLSLDKVNRDELLKRFEGLYNRLLFISDTASSMLTHSDKSVASFLVKGTSLEQDSWMKLHMLEFCDLPDLIYMFWNKFELDGTTYGALFKDDDPFLRTSYQYLGYIFLRLKLKYPAPSHGPIFDDELNSLLSSRSLDFLSIHGKNLKNSTKGELIDIDMARAKHALDVLKAETSKKITSRKNPSLRDAKTEGPPSTLRDALNCLTSLELKYDDSPSLELLSSKPIFLGMSTEPRFPNIRNINNEKPRKLQVQVKFFSESELVGQKTQHYDEHIIEYYIHFVKRIWDIQDNNRPITTLEWVMNHLKARIKLIFG